MGCLVYGINMYESKLTKHKVISWHNHVARKPINVIFYSAIYLLSGAYALTHILCNIILFLNQFTALGKKGLSLALIF